ncbi:putative RNA-directed DNA polymerase from transposon X-element [Nephila pilipes]|uniref:Putative RNA-directed DNA polymerase from transposon X-element n=1 Tax=Nephila pilipes TaxID=299642 RepID=A0A8X6Q658_NEPPI|nr:putative RNA-directed DNA polymerase from transposon X-element [Nephila pilipes]
MLKILSWNANGIRQKKDEFKHFISLHNPDIICMQETRLKPADNLNIANYITHRTDCITYAGGGTALLIKSSIPHHATVINTTLIENTTITIERRNNSPITILSTYKSPSKPMSSQELSAIFRNRDNCIIIGDLNAKHITWNPCRNNKQGTDLYQFIQNCGYSIHAPDQPTKTNHTGTGSVLDICVFQRIQLTFSRNNTSLI